VKDEITQSIEYRAGSVDFNPVQHRGSVLDENICTFVHTISCKLDHPFRGLPYGLLPVVAVDVGDDDISAFAAPVDGPQVALDIGGIKCIVSEKLHRVYAGSCRPTLPRVTSIDSI